MAGGSKAGQDRRVPSRGLDRICSHLHIWSSAVLSPYLLIPSPDFLITILNIHQEVELIMTAVLSYCYQTEVLTGDFIIPEEEIFILN